MKRHAKPSGTTTTSDFDQEIGRRVQSKIESYVFSHIYRMAKAAIHRYYDMPVDARASQDFPQIVLAASQVFSGNGRYKLQKPKWAGELEEFLEDLKARYEF